MKGIVSQHWDQGLMQGHRAIQVDGSKSNRLQRYRWADRQS